MLHRRQTNRFSSTKTFGFCHNLSCGWRRSKKSRMSNPESNSSSLPSCRYTRFLCLRLLVPPLVFPAFVARLCPYAVLFIASLNDTIWVQQTFAFSVVLSLSLSSTRNRGYGTLSSKRMDPMIRNLRVCASIFYFFSKKLVLCGLTRCGIVYISKLAAFGC